MIGHNLLTLAVGFASLVTPVTLPISQGEARQAREGLSIAWIRGLPGNLSENLPDDWYADPPKDCDPSDPPTCKGKDDDGDQGSGSGSGTDNPSQ